jgi:hypothetical protein
MTKKTQDSLAYLFAMICMIGVCCFIIIEIVNLKDNSCVAVTPKQLISGVIDPCASLFGSRQTIYSLQYVGKRKETGAYCEVNVSVTERKYESAMYGYKNE